MGSRAKKAGLEKKSPSSQARQVDPTRFAALIAVIALAVTPLALLPGLFISHDVIPKVVLLTTATALLFSLFGQWGPAMHGLWRRPMGRAFLILVLAQFASLLISTLFSSQIALSVGGTVWRRFGLIGQTAALVISVAVASLALARPAWVRTLFRAVSVCGGLAAIYGILQYFDLDPFLERRLYAMDYFGGIARPPSTMGHALYFSAYLVPVLFMSAGAARGEISSLWRRMQVAVAVLAGVAIVLSGTRSALAAAVIGGILFAWRAIGQARGGLSASLRYAGGAFAALLALTAFVLSPAGQNLRGRMAQWQADLGGPRLKMWKECPALVAQHPLVGGGPDVFANEFRRVESVQLSRAYPDFYNETPHNALIDAACAQGIPGLLILGGVLVLGWWAGRKSGPDVNPVSIGLQAAILGILISSMFASLTLVTSMYLWTVAGLAVALNPGSNSAVAATEERKTWRIPQAALIVFGLAYFLAGALLAMQDAAWSEMSAAVNGGNFAAARDAYARARSAGFGMPGYELWASREWAVLGRALTEAGNAADAASAWKLSADAASWAEENGEERFSAAYQSSVLGVAAGNLARAESEARQGIRLAPNWYKGHLLLSQVLGYMGKNEEAAREADVSAGLGWRKQ